MSNVLFDQWLMIAIQGPEEGGANAAQIANALATVRVAEALERNNELLELSLGVSTAQEVKHCGVVYGDGTGVMAVCVLPKHHAEVQHSWLPINLQK